MAGTLVYGLCREEMPLRLWRKRRWERLLELELAVMELHLRQREAWYQRALL